MIGIFQLKKDSKNTLHFACKKDRLSPYPLITENGLFYFSVYTDNSFQLQIQLFLQTEIN